ncbi:hypothetical protein ACC756_37880, partial [Rhizobium ruizarguesonis]
WIAYCLIAALAGGSAGIVVGGMFVAIFAVTNAGCTRQEQGGNDADCSAKDAQDNGNPRHSLRWSNGADAGRLGGIMFNRRRVAIRVCQSN